MKNVLITGTSQGIGNAIALKFLQMKDWVVWGVDIQASPEECKDHPNYHHIQMDISSNEVVPDYPKLPALSVIILNAGIQTGEEGKVMQTNFWGPRHWLEVWTADISKLNSILFIGSSSSISALEFPEYSASKAALVNYSRWLAREFAKDCITVNTLSPGGVYTRLNDDVMYDEKLWKQIMGLTPMEKWTFVEELAEWAYFLTVVNQSMTGENVLVDNGETRAGGHFVWPEKE